MRYLATVTFFIAVTSLFAGVATAQPRLHAGAGFTLATQPHGDGEPLGGTTTGVSVSFGVWVTRRIAVESEAMFGGGFSSRYSYNPGPSFSVDVVPSRRDTYVGFQLRASTHGIEPVIGLGYAHQAIARHATFTTSGATYFDDARTDHAIGLVSGLDVPIAAGRYFAVVPTFRLLAFPRGSNGDASTFRDPFGEQTQTGPLVFRYGIGGRVRF